MDRFLKVWGLRSVVLIAFVLAVPVSHVSAQGAPGVAVQAAAPAAQEEPADPDLGPSNEAVSPEEEAAVSSETDSDEQTPPPTDFHEPREDGT